MPKRLWTTRNSTHPLTPLHRTAPPRSPAQENPCQNGEVSTTTTHTENRYPLPHFSLPHTIPESWSTLCVLELSCRSLTLFLSCQGPFPPTLAPIPFTATRTTGSSFLAFRDSHHLHLASVTTPHHKPHGLWKKNKRQPAQRASLSAPRVRTVGRLGFSDSGHSHIHSLTVRDTRHLPAKAHTRDKEGRQEAHCCHRHLTTRLDPTLLFSYGLT
jgi:hypothetical protein